ncbi:carbohydrate porin [Paucibacter soli]|uniref:carbohydrate porin n=1 Tax=Paucibacter soli TaxID=3133433 RepID=UPI00309D4851
MRVRSSVLAAAAALAAALPAHAALDERQLLDALARLTARVEALEKRNTELEQALDSERLSEREPEMATRVKALEAQAQALQKPAARMEALAGVSVSASLSAVMQTLPARFSASEAHETRLNYRGDVQVSVPAGEWADISGKAFAHLRFGQGSGVGLRPSYTSTPNTLAFQTGEDADASFAILAQAGFQLELPLPRERATQTATSRLRLTLGKLDPFVYFDANGLADDESAKFLNNAFVHNPLLDSGGDVRADRFGFAPGAVLQWLDDSDKAAGWTASLGLFASGSGANFSAKPSKPLAIAQLETRRRFNYLPGSYRVYAWTQGQGQGFDGQMQRHRGLGLSLDQQVGDDLSLFARWGHQSAGQQRFDRALVAGLEWRGNAWRRGADAVGLALGRLRTAPGFAAASATLDADGDGRPDWGYAASGSEQLAELYYRWQIGPKLELTPDLQWLRRLGGDAAVRGGWVLGLRARLSL